MGIFNGVGKSKAQEIYEKILKNALLLKNGEEARCKAAFYDLWGDKNLPTSRKDIEEILSLFGKNAILIFQYHRAWQTFIKTIDSEWEILEPPYELEYHEDGTVTLAEETSSYSSEVSNSSRSESNTL